MNLEGKIAMVIGGSAGIGRAIALRFARAGARVTIAARSADLLQEAARDIERRSGRSVSAIPADVSEADGVEVLFERQAREAGGLDILVNSAGIVLLRYFWQMDQQEWDAVLNTNLRGTFLCTKLAARYLISEKRSGSIINIASTNAEIPTTGLAAYSASKAGILMLTRTAALELAPHGIRINAIAPGSTLTRMTEGVFAIDPVRQSFVDHTPLGRIGAPEDIASAALFLASDESRWITGQLLYCDGGQSLRGLPPYVEIFEQQAGSLVVAHTEA